MLIETCAIPAYGNLSSAMTSDPVTVKQGQGELRFLPGRRWAMNLSRSLDRALFVMIGGYCPYRCWVVQPRASGWSRGVAGSSVRRIFSGRLRHTGPSLLSCYLPSCLLIVSAQHLSGRESHNNGPKRRGLTSPGNRILRGGNKGYVTALTCFNDSILQVTPRSLTCSGCSPALCAPRRRRYIRQYFGLVAMRGRFVEGSLQSSILSFSTHAARRTCLHALNQRQFRLP